MYPGDGLGVVVFPEQFVVEPPGAERFVDAAEKSGPAAVGQRNHPRLAVDQAEAFVGEDFDPEFSRAQEFIKALKAGFGRVAQPLGLRLAPFRGCKPKPPKIP